MSSKPIDEDTTPNYKCTKSLLQVTSTKCGRGLPIDTKAFATLLWRGVQKQNGLRLLVRYQVTVSRVSVFPGESG